MAGNPAGNPATVTPSARLLGAAGSGMRALAGILASAEWDVAGSDAVFDSDAENPAPRTFPRGLQRIVPEGSLQSDILSSYAPPDLVVASPAISASHPDLVAAKAAGVKCLTLPQALRFLFRDRHRVAVAGTHGKSTTTALAAWLMQNAGRDVGHYIGAELIDACPEGRFGTDHVAILEACEFRSGFEALDPSTLLITGIRPDHFDCFPTLRDLENAYRRLVNTLDATSCLIINGECEISRRLADGVNCRVVSWTAGGSTAAEALPPNWTGRLLTTGPRGSTVELQERDGPPFQFETHLVGQHNLRNVLSAAALTVELGLDLSALRVGMSTFQGIQRRFQQLPPWRGVHRIDDYAHHPDAIRATLQAVRACFPNNRIVAVFEAHQISRVRELGPEFVEALSAADLRFIVPVFAARESANPADRCAAAATLAIPPRNPDGSDVLVATLDHLRTTLHDSTRPGDVLVTMGAGQIDRIHYELD